MARALNERPFDLAVNARAVQIIHNQGKVAGVKVMTPDKGRITSAPKRL